MRPASLNHLGVELIQDKKIEVGFSEMCSEIGKAREAAASDLAAILEGICKTEVDLSDVRTEIQKIK